MEIIKVEELTKDFRRRVHNPGLLGSIKGLFENNYEIKEAVKKIGFSINEGEIVGYIGPNGAGKSTTIKMMAGILVPTSGEVVVNGLIPYKKRVQHTKNIGVVFGQRTQLWWDIPVMDSLNLMRYMYKIPEQQFKRNLNEYTEVLGMSSFLDIPVRQLSLGQRMRADICASLLHDPKILFLDEPTIGLDVMVKKNIREFIKKINKEKGTTVILTTHDMKDIEELCTRVILIDKGELCYDGVLERLRELYGKEQILTVQFTQLVKNLKVELEGIKSISLNECNAVITYDARQVNSLKIIESLIHNYPVADFQVKEQELESVIRDIYGKVDKGEMIQEEKE